MYACICIRVCMHACIGGALQSLAMDWRPGWMDACMHRWGTAIFSHGLATRMDGWMGGGTDGWTDGRMNVFVYLVCVFKAHLCVRFLYLWCCYRQAEGCCCFCTFASFADSFTLAPVISPRPVVWTRTYTTSGAILGVCVGEKESTLRCATIETLEIRLKQASNTDEK